MYLIISLYVISITLAFFLLVSMLRMNTITLQELSINDKIAHVVLLFSVAANWIIVYHYKIAIFYSWIIDLPFIMTFIFIQLFHIVALKQLRNENWTDSFETQGNSLVITGVYSFVRHPIYLAFLLYGLILFISLPAAFILGIAVMFFPFARIEEEESRLLIVFGDKYLEYQRNVKWKLIPYIY